MRLYKTQSKKCLAMAYGFRKTETLVKRIEDKISQADDEIILELGEWKGHKILLPIQVKTIVYLLGDPQTPDSVFIEI